MALIEINWRPDAKQLRSFGLFGVVAFGALGALVYYKHSVVGIHMSAQHAANTAYVLWVLAAVCGVLAVVAPALLKPLYIALSAISAPIGFVVSHVVMGVLFYGVFTPVALIFRMMGRDPLDRKFEPARASYWIPREQVKDLKRYFRQY